MGDSLPWKLFRGYYPPFLFCILLLDLRLLCAFSVTVCTSLVFYPYQLVILFTLVVPMFSAEVYTLTVSGSSVVEIGLNSERTDETNSQLIVCTSLADSNSCMITINNHPRNGGTFS